MIKGKRINKKPGTPINDKKNKNPYLKPDGGIDLIDRFPSYERKGKKGRNKSS